MSLDIYLTNENFIPKYRCSICGKLKPRSDFYKNSHRRSGIDSRCKECDKKRKDKLVNRKQINYPQSKVCSNCKIEKLQKDFYKDRRNTDGLASQCKECESKSARKRRIKNRNRKHINFPKEKKCINCKIIKPTKEFHKDRTNKDGLSNICKECDNRGRKRRAIKYRKRENIEYPKTKKCNLCGKVKSANQFRKDKDRLDGLYSRCNKCVRILGAKFRDEFIQFKSNIGCKLCGEKDGACLEFHHKNPKEKEFSLHVKTTRPNFSNEKFHNELKKCICLCANCHKKLHYWYKRLFELPEKKYLLLPQLVF